MKDNDKLVALIRLRDMLYFGVRPTLRQCGFSAEIIQALVKERLIQLGDRMFGDDPDRYVIEEILPAGHSFISQQHALRNPPPRFS
jgi:glutaredoxin-related protein